jgi:hypothetical protein
MVFYAWALEAPPFPRGSDLRSVAEELEDMGKMLLKKWRYQPGLGRLSITNARVR